MQYNETITYDMQLMNIFSMLSSVLSFNILSFNNNKTQSN